MTARHPALPAFTTFPAPGELPLPAQLYIEVTNRCQSLCVTCPLTFGGLEASRDLTWDEFVGIVDQFPLLERVVLHGIGEPLLNRHLARFIRHLKAERGSYVLFNSNAIALTPARAAALIESGVDEFRVSCDSARPETYLRVRGVPAHAKVVRNIAHLTAAQGRLGRDHPRVSLWFTGMRDNLGELPDLVRLAAQVGVPEVYLQRLVYFGAGMAEEGQSIYANPTAAERAVVQEAGRVAAELGIAFNGSGAMSPLDHFEDPSPTAAERPWAGCNRPWRLSYITSHGNVLPCCIAPFSSKHYQGIILGNVFTTPFADIWRGAAYDHFRTALASEAPPEPCEGCGLRWSL